MKDELYLVFSSRAQVEETKLFKHSSIATPVAASIQPRPLLSEVFSDEPWARWGFSHHSYVLRVQHRQIRSQIQFDYIGHDVGVCSAWFQFVNEGVIHHDFCCGDTAAVALDWHEKSHEPRQRDHPRHPERGVEPLTLALLRGSDSVGSHVAAAAGVSVGGVFWNHCLDSSCEYSTEESQLRLDSLTLIMFH